MFGLLHQSAVAKLSRQRLRRYGGHNVILEIQATMPSPPATLKPYMNGVYIAYGIVSWCYCEDHFLPFREPRDALLPNCSSNFAVAMCSHTIAMTNLLQALQHDCFKPELQLTNSTGCSFRVWRRMFLFLNHVLPHA